MKEKRKKISRMRTVLIVCGISIAFAAFMVNPDQSGPAVQSDPAVILTFAGAAVACVGFSCHFFFGVALTVKKD